MKNTFLSLTSMFLLLYVSNTHAQTPQELTISATSVSPTQVLINWQGAEQVNSTATISYCGGATVAQIPNSQSYLINNLTPNTAYSIKVTVTDEDNNSVQSDCVAVKTVAKPVFKVSNLSR